LLDAASIDAKGGQSIMRANHIAHADRKLSMLCRTCPVYKRICQPNAADGTTTAPVHLLTGHVRPNPLVVQQPSFTTNAAMSNL